MQKKFNYAYTRYLISDEWIKRKSPIIKKRKCCEFCGSKINLVVHHKTYENIFNEKEKDLMVLCKICHEYLHEKKRKDREVYSSFCMCNSEELKFLLPTLKNSEIGLMITLSQYLIHNDCCLRHPNGKPLTIKQIEKICGYSQSNVYRYIKPLLKKNIIYKKTIGKKSTYYLNPLLFKKGNVNLKSQEVIEMFENYVIRSKDNTMWKDLV